MKLLRLGALCASLTLLAACDPITIQNPFGGAGLTLTGNFGNDLPGMKAYAADISAGIKKNAADARAFFIVHCPTVYDVDAKAQGVDPSQVKAVAAGAGLSLSDANAQKNLGNVQKVTGLAKLACDSGSAADAKTMLVNFVKAAEQVTAWVQAARGG